MNWYVKVLRNYAVFEGRARRKEYWMFVLFNLIFSVVLAILGSAMQFDWLSNIYSLVVLVPSLAVAVRRMHDVNKSGWFILIPIYNLILAVTEGDSGENRFGPDPKGQSSLNNDALDSHMAG